VGVIVPVPDVAIPRPFAQAEPSESADGTALTWTEQGAYLDRIDGPRARALRKGGATEMLDGLWLSDDRARETRCTGSTAAPTSIAARMSDPPGRMSRVLEFWR
jgi:hypothetical protein